MSSLLTKHFRFWRDPQTRNMQIEQNFVSVQLCWTKIVSLVHELKHLLIYSSLFQHHILSVHEKRFDFKCELCGKDFTTITRLKMHTANNHSKNNGFCEICNKSFSTNLKRHKFLVHKEEMEHWICEKCPKKHNLFFSEAIFHRHNETKH